MENQVQGQIFFIHNRVESIYEVAQYLNTILPGIRIAIAHGQMAERELETIMMDFINHEFDLLLATTIVESGLDIPNVNTIIVNNADQFGLSQLYQLRGRVGRSNVQAYAYLLTPREKVLTEIARKRLSILQELNHLGAGFKIANYDLELRGAGNVLGSKQSGHIASIGFEMYTHMIEEAVAKIKNEELRSSTDEVKLELNLEANLPDFYINSMNQRLDAYKKISGCETEEELWEMRDSLEDRFGKLPTSAVSLFHTMQIKIQAKTLFINNLNLFGHDLSLGFTDQFQPDPQKAIAFMTKSPFPLKMMPDNQMNFELPDASTETVLKCLQTIKRELL